MDETTNTKTKGAVRMANLRSEAQECGIRGVLLWLTDSQKRDILAYCAAREWCVTSVRSATYAARKLRVGGES